MIVVAIGVIGISLPQSEPAFLGALDDGVVTLLAISHAGYLTRKARPTTIPATARTDD